MKKIISGLSVLFVFFNTVPNGFAVGSGGFENASFSAKALGESNAVVAQADEPAAISYNPAGIVELPGIQMQSNMHFISATVFHDSPTDKATKSAGTINSFPTAYLTINPEKGWAKNLAFGVGSDFPFGLADKYDSNLPEVHYTGWRNYLKMYTIKPVVAAKINDKISFGGGPVYYRVFDFGGIEAYPNKAAFGTFPGAILTDGQVRLNLEGNTWGWQFGALVKPHPKHAVGFYFRSPITIHTRGRVKVENSASGYFETGANAKLDLPLNFTFAYAYKPNKKAVIESDFGYTRWSAYERLYLNNDSVNARENFILSAIGKSDKDYSDAFSLHLGGQYQMTSKFVLRAGSFFYWSPVPGDHWTPAVPDSNRVGASIGLGYNVNKNLVFDLMYLHAFHLRRNINNSISESIGGSVDGDYFSDTQIFSFSLTYKFDPFTKAESPITNIKNNMN
jgi:long-chain fatty acid transport protein